MSKLLVGILSFILGGFLGVFLMACFKINKGDE